MITFSVHTIFKMNKNKTTDLDALFLSCGGKKSDYRKGRMASSQHCHFARILNSQARVCFGNFDSWSWTDIVKTSGNISLQLPRIKIQDRMTIFLPDILLFW